MKRTLSFVAAAGIAGALALGAAAPVFAQAPPGCAELCAVSCVKPLSIPDRWDDVTAIPGYDGSAPKRPNWRNNGRYDEEAFTDQNGNGLWDPGETFLDANGNGAYDREAYDALLTGFVAEPIPGNSLAPAGDLGLQITLHPGSPADAPVPGQYFTIGLPPANRGTPDVSGDGFRENMAMCNPSLVGAGDRCMLTPGTLLTPANQAMRELLAQDPNAHWDPVTKSVQGSEFPADTSPRILRIVVHDPAIALANGSSTVRVTKVIGFFMERMPAVAEVRGYLMRVPSEGELCGASAGAGDWMIACATPATPTSWGRVKATYR